MGRREQGRRSQRYWIFMFSIHREVLLENRMKKIPQIHKFPKASDLTFSAAGVKNANFGKEFEVGVFEVVSSFYIT